MTPLVRLPNWRTALLAAIEGYRRRPHVYGSVDCALFTADCVKAETNRDFGEPYRGRYSTEAQARAVLAGAGYRDLSELAAAFLPEIHRSRARIGDVVAIDVGDDWVLGVCNGATIAVLGPEGLGMLPMSFAKRGFAV